MKKILGFLIIVSLILFAVFYRNSNNKDISKSNQISEEQKLGLPDSWTKVEDAKVEYKLEKKVEKGLKSEIVLIKSESKDASNPTKYVDRLVAGAKSTIPTLRISTNKRSSENEIYLAVISGYYYNQKNIINLAQRVYIKGETVYTLTASFGDDLTAEIDQIMDAVVKEKVSW